MRGMRGRRSASDETRAWRRGFWSGIALMVSLGAGVTVAQWALQNPVVRRLVQLVAEPRFALLELLPVVVLLLLVWSVVGMLQLGRA